MALLRGQKMAVTRSLVSKTAPIDDGASSACDLLQVERVLAGDMNQPRTMTSAAGRCLI